MTKKIILINETDDETRVAIVEDSVLQEMLIEHRTVEQSKNNIYKGTVVQIQSSLQAAFVDFGNNQGALAFFLTFCFQGLITHNNT
ncbi:MAG: hypothetical protein HQ517_06430, partial [SAR324 cluster bacterium]|nr:hypothetical protein [SAR324 cluster bacterium]